MFFLVGWRQTPTKEGVVRGFQVFFVGCIVGDVDVDSLTFELQLKFLDFIAGSESDSAGVVAEKCETPIVVTGIFRRGVQPEVHKPPVV